MKTSTLTSTTRRTFEIDSLDEFFNRTERLAQTRPERLRLHLYLVELIVRQLENHAAAGRLQEARAAWGASLECFVEDPEQKFTLDSWALLSRKWPAAQRLQLQFREPLAVPSVHTA